MSIVSCKGVSILGMSAAVPKGIIDNLEMNQQSLFTAQERINTVETTGIRYRRKASSSVCSSDLCFMAADKLLSEMGIDRTQIDLLIFISQTPDYRQPATAPILQHRLGLSKTTASFDVNLACSGFVYGLSIAYSYCSQPGIDRVLLLVGETLSKIVSPNDRATSLLFGDGGTATIIEKDGTLESSYFSLNSDGSGYNVLSIEGGGYRNKSSEDTLVLTEYQDGSLRTKEHLNMDGLEVFSFTVREVPKDIKKLMTFANKTESEIDYIVLHQANKMMTDFFLKKIKFPMEKAPYSLHNYGNTSAVSIPLTMISELQNELKNERLTLLLSGFGGGLSWGSSIINTKNLIVPDIVECD